MTNHEIARAFAAGAIEGRNGNGTIYIHGDTIYSYGSHWPMARRNGRTVFVNRDKYSRTTSKQTGYVAGACACAGLTIVDVTLNQLKGR
jgi:hypothetical protein